VIPVDWPALAFRPPSAVNRLRRGSCACPLALRDAVGGLLGEALTIPLVSAPSVAVASAALVAAKEARSVLGLSLPEGEGPEGWFEAVTGVADELAPGLPLLLGATVTLRPDPVGEGRAARHLQRLVEAGFTHLALELDLLPPERRAEELARVAEPALERGLGVECLLPAGSELLPDPSEVEGLLGELGSLGASPDLAAVRYGRGGAAGADALLSRLAELEAAAAGVALSLRGAAPRVLRFVGAGLLRAADDAGAAAAAAAASADPARAEARAYAEAAALLDALPAEGSAVALSEALGRAREE